MSDYRQQEEVEERERHAIDVLLRVDQGLATHEDVLFLASELGLSETFKETET